MEPFEQAYELYFRDVYRYVLSLSRDAAVAEEVTQETFFQAMKSMPSFRGECKMTVWLCQIAKHIYFAGLKKQKRRQEAAARLRTGQTYAALDASGTAPHAPGAAPNASGTAPYASGVAPSLEQLFCEEETAMKIHGILHGLEEPYKEVFMLRVFGELPYKKIAHIFGKTESWARVTYHRAKLKITDGMEERDGKDNM